MDENVARKFGPLTYMLMAWGMLGPFWFLLGLTAFYFVLLSAMPQVMASVNFPLGGILAAADLLILAGCLSGAYLEYSNYQIALEGDHVTVKKGFLNVRESGVPYRRIKSVDIGRDVLDQMLGASTVTITVLGEVEEGAPGAEEHMRLPYLPKDTAIKIQDALLSRAEVEKVNVEQGALK